MSEFETKPGVTGDNAPGALEGVQKQLNTLLIALIVLSAAFAFFLWRQNRYFRADLEAIKPVAATLLQGFNQERPNITAFVEKLTEYARTHPDFAPIAQKYQLLSTSNTAPAVVKPTAPAPAAPAQKKN